MSRKTPERRVYVREVTLTDNSKVYDVVILGEVECNCEDLSKAIILRDELLDAIDTYSISIGKPVSDVGKIID